MSFDFIDMYTYNIYGVLCFVYLWRLNETTFHFRVFNKQFVGLNNNGNGIDVVAVSTTPGKSETFEIVRKSDDKSRVQIRAPNGFFLQVILLNFLFSFFAILFSFSTLGKQDK